MLPVDFAMAVHSLLHPNLYGSGNHHRQHTKDVANQVEPQPYRAAFYYTWRNLYEKEETIY